MRLDYSALLFVLTGVLTGAFPNLVAATTYEVGENKPYQRIADVPPLAPGDVIEISPGLYTEAMRWTTSGTPTAPITIRGIGSPRPVMDGTGVGVSGVLPEPRALFQIEGDYVTVENLEFRNAHNDVGNGSGIRVVYGRSAVIRNVRITECDMGLMANEYDELLVEQSEIASNGSVSGPYSHNVYIDEGGTATFRFNYIHDSVSGQNFKSRSHFTQLLYNHIADSADGEVSLVDSGSTTQPYSNALMLGNIVISKVRSAGSNQLKFIDFGQDIGIAHSGILYLVHNTLIAGSPAVQFLWASSPESSIVAEHNIFYGSDTIVGMDGNGTVGFRNWVPTSASVPSTWSENLLGADPGFVDGSTGNYRLTAGSGAVDRASGPSVYVDGAGEAQVATPEWEYSATSGQQPRLQNGAYDLGAYEALTESDGDTTAPVISLGSPVDSETVSGTVLISASATDNVAVTRVDVYVDGELQASVEGFPYQWNWDTTLTWNGAHILEVTAYDAAGNIGVSGSVTVFVANAPTEISLAAKGL
jgi:Bacterial Ig domain/Right handed beta helix region